MTKAALGFAFALPFLLAGWLSPHDPRRQYREYAGRPPHCGSPCFALGTDEFGRDVLSRLLHGGRVSLAVGLGASFVAAALGGLLGAVAGYSGGWPDRLLCLPMHLLLGLPWIYLLLALRAALPLSLPPEGALVPVMLVLAVAGCAAPFRICRQTVRGALAAEAVAVSLGLGASRWYVLRRHLWPAALPALQAQWLTLFPGFVVAEVSLSFLGLGIGDPGVSWGSLLASLRQYPVLVSHWWMFSPALALAMLLSLLPAPRLGWRGRE